MTAAAATAANARKAAIAIQAMRLLDVYTLGAGKIVRMDQFTERSEALEAVGRSA